MGKRDVHTGKNTEGQGWVNKVAGRVESTHRTQEAAAGGSPQGQAAALGPREPRRRRKNP
jgi:hypothetical protein